MSDGILKAKLLCRKKTFMLDLEFEFQKSEFCAVYGPSGCGKTTLMRALAGLETLGKSSYVELKQEVWHSKELAKETCLRNVAYVPQQPVLFPHLNVEQNLQYSQKRAAVKKIPLKLDWDEVIAALSIEEYLQKRPAELSGGQKQRVALAQALLSAPNLLLLDEPLSGLDRKNKEVILKSLKEFQKKLRIPVFYVSHSLEELDQIADEILVMQNGKIVKQSEYYAYKASLEQEKHIEARIVESSGSYIKLMCETETDLQIGDDVKISFVVQETRNQKRVKSLI